MASDERESVALGPDVLAALDELARVYTGGDREAMVRFAIHRFQDAHFDEIGARREAEDPPWGHRDAPAFGDETSLRSTDEPMVVTMRELQRLHEVFGRYPDGPIVIREEAVGRHQDHVIRGIEWALTQEGVCTTRQSQPGPPL